MRRQSVLKAVRWDDKTKRDRHRPYKWRKHLWRNGYHREAHRAAVFFE